MYLTFIDEPEATQEALSANSLTPSEDIKDFHHFFHTHMMQMVI
jgi:hypothetical protein